jgi:hypothetical protein
MSERVLVSGTCAICGDPFERVVIPGATPPPLYCKSGCKRTAKTRRNELRLSEHPCLACGEPAELQWRRRSRVPLCVPCRNVVWTSCWRKIPHPDAATAVAAGWAGTVLYSYRCTVCPAWHGTSQPDPLPDARQAIVDRIGAAMQLAGYDFHHRDETRRIWTVEQAQQIADTMRARFGVLTHVPASP